MAAALLVVTGSVTVGWGRVTQPGGPGGPASAAGTGPAADTSPGAPPGSAPAGVGLEPGDLRIRRAPFCDLVDDERVPVALGGPVQERDVFEPGDAVTVTAGARERLDEHGCAWSGSPGEARAWLFAPAVPVRQARELAAAARDEPGCAGLAGRPTYGRPGLTRVCRAGDGTVEASLRGLFGDAWLTCEVTERPSAGEAPNPDDVRSRAEQWCLHVATTLGAER